MKNNTPRRPWIWFADGGMAELVRMRHSVNEDGDEGYDIWLRPTAALRDEFGLIEGDNMVEGMVKRWYYHDDVRPIRPDDPVQRKIFIYTTLNGEDTDFGRSDAYFKEQIRGLKSENKILRSQSAWLRERMSLMSTDLNRYIRSNVLMFNEANKVRKHITKEDGGSNTRGDDLGEEI